jgi:hypothetical protein
MRVVYMLDDCQFDTELDSLGIAANASGADGLARWYMQAFVASIVENPGKYAYKVTKQLLYGLKMAMPPHALGPIVDDVRERRMTAIEMLNESALNTGGLSDKPLPVSAPFVGHYADAANLVYRVLSLMIAAALVISFAGLAFSRFRRERVAVYAALASLVWLSNMASVALTHTLDVWRYIVPVVPAGIIAFSLIAYLFWQRSNHLGD